MSNILRLKKLKLVNKTSLRDAIIYMMQYDLNKWWVPRRMQMCMRALGAKISLTDTEELMEDIFQEMILHPSNIFDRRMHPYLKYKCSAYFQPNS